MTKTHEYYGPDMDGSGLSYELPCVGEGCEVCAHEVQEFIAHLKGECTYCEHCMMERDVRDLAAEGATSYWMWCEQQSSEAQKGDWCDCEL